MNFRDRPGKAKMASRARPRAKTQHPAPAKPDPGDARPPESGTAVADQKREVLRALSAVGTKSHERLYRNPDMFS